MLQEAEDSLSAFVFSPPSALEQSSEEGWGNEPSNPEVLAHSSRRTRCVSISKDLINSSVRGDATAEDVALCLALGLEAKRKNEASAAVKTKRTWKRIARPAPFASENAPVSTPSAANEAFPSPPVLAPPPVIEPTPVEDVSFVCCCSDSLKTKSFFRNSIPSFSRRCLHCCPRTCWCVC